MKGVGRWAAETVPNPFTNGIDVLVLDENNQAVCTIFNPEGEKGLSNAMDMAKHIVQGHQLISILRKVNE